MRTYIITNTDDSKDIQIFSTVGRAFVALHSIARRYIRNNLFVDIKEIGNKNLQMLIVDKYCNLINTYYLLEKEIQ